MRHLEPQGVNTLLEDEVEFQEYLTDRFREQFRRYGYRPVITPTFEYLDLFQQTGSTDFDRMVKLIDRDGRILVLRPDATVPVSRMTARLYPDVELPMKFSYINSVYKWADPLRGERMEVLQAGVEAYNQPEPDCDAEVLAMGIRILTECGIERLHVDLGHAGWMDGLRQEAGIAEKPWLRILQALDSRNAELLDSALAPLEMADTVREAFKILPELYGELEDVLDRAQSLALNDAMLESVQNLREVSQILEYYHPNARIHGDMSFINPMPYYTGVIFKGYTPGCGEPLFQGGRYDRLVESFGKPKPACGMGLNISLIAEVLDKMNAKQWNPSGTDYLVVYNTEERENALKLSEALREKGYVVETERSEEGAPSKVNLATFRNAKQILEVNREALRVVNVIRNEVVRTTQEQFINQLEPQQWVQSIH